jgi:hypothetical protein
MSGGAAVQVRAALVAVVRLASTFHVLNFAAPEVFRLGVSPKKNGEKRYADPKSDEFFKAYRLVCVRNAYG